jgi:alkylhydroperoxidase/carboxymuconolactone decarboxylase family protein YurZ
MSNRGSAARGARAKNAGGPKGTEAHGHSPYGYAHMDWLAREDPEYARARGPLSVLSIGEGKELSVKYREMIIIGILAFRGRRQDGVVAHMRRAIEHGATKRELLEAIAAQQASGIRTTRRAETGVRRGRRRSAARPRSRPSAPRTSRSGAGAGRRARSSAP